MQFSLLPPRHQLVEMLTRIYQQGLTTTSGGNLSILEPNGDLWITPAGIDKGALSPDDIVCVHPDGTSEGRHRPSSEYPFHRMIYAARPDVHALVHAHPPALVSFSIVRKTPETGIIPQARDICGAVGYAPYALPGSDALGGKIAQTFAQGYQVVLLENHGVVTAGENLLQAFQRFETLEYCAQINLLSSRLGAFSTLSDAQITTFRHVEAPLTPLESVKHTSRELELRLEICRFVRRAYERKLMTSTGGTVSARTDSASFLITPYGYDRHTVQPEDLVLIQKGEVEPGKISSRALRLHQQIYADHPAIGCIMSAQPPHATTYAISQLKFDTHTIPESYIVLRDMPIAPYGWAYHEPERVSKLISKDTPVVLLQNDAVLATGGTLLQTFDRMEVAEFSAQALINTLSIGQLVPIGEDDIADLKAKFLG